MGQRRPPRDRDFDDNAEDLTLDEWAFEDSYYADDFVGFFDLPVLADPNFESSQGTLQTLTEQVGTPSALVYARFNPAGSTVAQTPSAKQLQNPQPSDVLQLVIVTPTGQPQQIEIPTATREKVIASVRALQIELTDRTRRRQSNYLKYSQALYNWLVLPLESTLAAEDIGHVSFIMAPGLRSLPLAALHDGEQFLLENYSIGLMPSFSLTELAPAYGSGSTLHQSEVLAMGASRFTDPPPLPAVEAALDIIADDLWAGEAFLHEHFTLANLTTEISKEQYGIVHLATHAVFEPGNYEASYIQLWNEKITLPELDKLNLSESTIDLIILSACNTAVGDRTSEYGFAGFAVNAGSQSALASLWPVSDEGTLGFMTQFYQQLSAGKLRSDSLRQAQISMLQGEVSIVNGQVIGPDGEAIAMIPELAESGNWDFAHPFYWSAFTMIGNPW